MYKIRKVLTAYSIHNNYASIFRFHAGCESFNQRKKDKKRSKTLHDDEDSSSDCNFEIDYVEERSNRTKRGIY